MDTSTKLQEVQNIIDYTFKDPLILWEALQAPGSIAYPVGSRNTPDGNKRLAILGDTLLKLVLIEGWYQSAQSRAGQIVSEIGSNANKERVGRLHGIDHYINRNASQGAVISPVTMTETIEAILAAVYIDGDLTAVKQVMQTLGLGPS